MFNNINTTKICDICLKLTTKTPKRRQWRRSGISIVDLNQSYKTFASASIVESDQVIFFRVKLASPSVKIAVQIIRNNLLTLRLKYSTAEYLLFLRKHLIYKKIITKKCTIIIIIIIITIIVIIIT